QCGDYSSMRLRGSQTRVKFARANAKALPQSGSAGEPCSGGDRPAPQNPPNQQPMCDQKHHPPGKITHTSSYRKQRIIFVCRRALRERQRSERDDCGRSCRGRLRTRRPTLALLRSIGCPLPEETTIGIDLGYATCVYAIPDDAPTEWKGIRTFAQA